MTDSAAVLGWALTQAGVAPPAVEEAEDPLTFPAAEAAKPATPKVTPKEAPKALKEEKKEQPVAATANDTVEEEPAISETVDIIKNDNNVVVFFCK